MRSRTKWRSSPAGFRMGKEVARRFVAEGGRVVVNGGIPRRRRQQSRTSTRRGKLAVAQVGDVAMPGYRTRAAQGGYSTASVVTLTCSSTMPVFARRNRSSKDRREPSTTVSPTPSRKEGALPRRPRRGERWRCAQGRGGAIVQTGSM